MNKQTIRKLKAISKEQGFHGYYKFKKANVISLLSEQLNQDMPILPTRTNKHKRDPITPVKTIPDPKEMEKYEEQHMTKNGSVVKNKVNE